MITKFKIEATTKLVKCTEEEEEGFSRVGAGRYEQVISAEQARSIDECERLLLETNYASLRDGYAEHLSELSRTYALEQFGDLSLCEIKRYQVDGEIGRFEFDNYCEKSSGESLFPALHGKEWYRTSGFKEIGFVHGTVEGSYRKTSDQINRIRHQEGATPFRTLRDNTKSEGEQLMAHMEEQAVEILETNGFTADGVRTEKAIDHSEQKLVTLPPEQVAQAIQACAPEPEWIADMTDNPVDYEEPTQTTQICIDDVNVKRQKTHRNDEDEEAEKKRKYAHNTVAHIAHAEDSYIINGRGLANVLRLVLAFLLNNQLLSGNLVFFLDGQRSLYTATLALFCWIPAVQVILDWYHLKKRCKEQLSTALKGYNIRNPLLDELLPCLWHGCVDKAIELLQAIEPEHIKNQDALDKLIAYLKRNQSYIPCYSVRKHFDLCNSSNRGEKCQDLIVSKRQKHNGMSWSRQGSAALAAISALVKNGEYKLWFQSNSLSFSFSA